MDKADADRIQQLCSLIALEKNREKFLVLVEELNQILAINDDRLREKREDPDRNQ